MSHLIVYSIDKDGDVIEFQDIDKADHFSLLVWEVMFELYNDYFVNDVVRPDWMPEDSNITFAELQMTGDMSPFWRLYKHEDVLLDHRIVFAATFDRVVILKENFPRVITAFENFINTMTGDTFKEFFGKYDFSKLREFVEVMKNFQEDEEIIGMAVCSSVVASFWEKYEDDEKYMPYNILKDKNHKTLFDVLKLNESKEK